MCPSEGQGEVVPGQDLALKAGQAGAAKPESERFAKQPGFPAALSGQRVFGLGLATLQIQVGMAGMLTSCP